MAGIALGELGLDEFRSGIICNLGIKPAAQFVIELLVAPKVAGFQHGGANGQIAARQADAFIDRAGGLADLQFQVPQHIQDVFDDLFLARRFLVGQHEQQIDIGIWCKFATAVPADGRNAQALALGRVCCRINMIGGKIVNQADDLVGKERQRLGNLLAIRFARIETMTDFRPSVFHCRLQKSEELLTDLLRQGLAGNELVNLADHRGAVDDPALFRNRTHLVVTNSAAQRNI